MKDLSTVLISGASTGIGRVMAEQFARNGHDVILTARNEDRLNEVADQLKQYNIKTTVIALDLSRPDAAETLYKKIKEAGIEVDILVNNAGFGTSGFIPDLPIEKELNMIQLNVSSLVHLCHLFSKDMVQRKKGSILNVGSIAGFQPGPFMANYYATKAYVQSFSEALREELKNYGVNVSVLCPGPTSSEFFERAGTDKSRLKSSALIYVQTPEAVAKTAYKGLKKKKAVIISGFSNKIMAHSVRFTPRIIVRKLAGYLNKRI